MMFSTGEQLLLVLFAELYEKLGVKSDVINASLVRDAIEQGHDWALRDYQVRFNNEVGPEVASQTREIMEMWAHIENSWDGLSGKDQALVEMEASRLGREVVFTGFAGNDEAQHLSVALFLINRLGLYGKYRGRDLNCHCPSIAMRHLPMLMAYRCIRAALTIGQPMSADQLTEVLTARHPFAAAHEQAA